MSDPYNPLIVLPLLYAYMLGSFTGLRKWIAIQQVPASTSLPETPQAVPVFPTRTKIFTFAKGYCLFLLAVSLYQVAVLYELDNFLDYVHITIIVPVFLTANLACLDWFGVPLTWHRTLKGKVRSVVHMAELSKAKQTFVKTVIAIMTIGLPTGAISYRSDICASAMLFSIIIAAIFIEVPMLLLYINAMFAYADDNKEAVDVNLPALGHGLDWMVTFLAATALSGLFATALRFDFANHVEAAQSPTPVIDVQAVPAPVAEAPGGQLTAGVKPPSHWAVVTVPFKRRYFQAVLAPWILGHIITYVLIDQGLLSSLGRATYTLYAMLLSFHLMLATLAAVALVRGEAKKMWKYEEVWEVTPVAAEASVAVDAGAATYEGVKKKYEDLVSKC